MTCSRHSAQGLCAVPAMKAAEKQIAEAESAFRAFEAFRSRLDENLTVVDRRPSPR